MRAFFEKLMCAVLCICMLFAVMAVPGFAENNCPSRIRVHLLGDSTVCSYSSASNASKDITGWGQALEAMFNEHVTFFNHARSGATTDMFLNGTATYYGKQWNTVLKDVRSGDYVLIQFGHNDSSTSETYGITKETYKSNLVKMVTDVAAANAVPVLVTSPERKTYAQYSSTGYGDTFSGYLTEVRNIAAEKNIALIELNEWSKNKYAEICGDDFKKDKTAIGDIPALDAFFAGDITHFSSEGAISIATYIAGELEKINSSFKEVRTTGTVTKADIEYPTIYSSEDFEKATSENNAVSLGNQDHWGNQNKMNDCSKNGGSRTVYEENENKFLRFFDPMGYENQLYFKLGKQTAEDIITVDFRFRMSDYTSVGGTQQIKMEMYSTASVDASKRINAWYGEHHNGAAKGSTKMQDNTVTNTKFAEGNYKPGDWNTVRIILDQKNQKNHLMLNGKALYFDGSNLPNGKLYGFRFGVCTKTTQYADFDDIRVYSISEKKAAQMLFEGVEEYLADKNFVADPDSLSGDVSINGGFYLPASAASDASVTYGTPALAMGGVFTIGSNTAGTKEPYYSVSRIKAPYGYNDAGAAQCYLPVTVKIGAVNITGNARLNIQRHLLTNTDATLEIGVPKLGAVQVTSANGSNVKMSTFKGSDTTIWSQTRITNIGNTERKLLAGIAYYSADGRLLSISGTKSDELGFEVVTIAPGASSVISRAVKADKITTGVAAKFFVIDAETLKPSVKSIIISD